MKLADRIAMLAESATLAVSAKAAAMKAEGIDVVSFGAGEPDFDTPAHVKQAAKDALDAGRTKYVKPASGLLETKQAICAKFRRDNGLEYTPEQVLVTVGGKEALFLAFMATVSPGDEVLIPSPYWVSYPEQVKLAGGTPVFVEGREDDGFLLTPQQILDACTDRTRVLVLNSPSNPGGFSYAPEQLDAIAEALAGRELIVFSDEMYDRLTYGGTRFKSFAATGDEWMGKTVTFNAGSKAYSMTGWRVGYAAGPAPIIKAMAKLQSQTTSNTATFNQAALAAALNGDQGCIEQMRQEFERRAAHMHRRLNELPGVRCIEPTGAFYCFPNVSGTYRRLGVDGSLAFAGKVLEEARVALVPGVAFGCDANVRLSFATALERIDEGIDRLARLLG